MGRPRKVRLDSPPVHLAQAGHARGQRHALHVEHDLIAEPDLHSLHSFLHRNRHNMRVIGHRACHVPAISFRHPGGHRCRCCGIRDAPPSGEWALLVRQDRLDGSTLHGREPHGNDGRLVQHWQLQRGDQVADRFFLIRLDVEENRVGLVRAAGGDQLCQQRLLHQIETHHEKRSEAKREQKKQCAIVGAMKIGQTLPDGER